MSTERDTHFQGSAKRLWRDISQQLGFLQFGFSPKQQASIDEAIQTRIAQHDYDLAILCFTSIPASKQGEYGDPPDCVEHVPDSL
jgi:hypothetical protein